MTQHNFSDNITDSCTFQRRRTGRCLGYFVTLVSPILKFFWCPQSFRYSFKVSESMLPFLPKLSGTREIATNERNITCLRRLSNYMRASLSQQRLSALVLRCDI